MVDTRRVRGRVSGGTKSGTYSLRTTSSQMDKKVRISLGVQRQVVSISGTANRKAADVCLVKLRQVPKIHRKQPIVEGFSSG